MDGINCSNSHSSGSSDSDDDDVPLMSLVEAKGKQARPKLPSSKGKRRRIEDSDDDDDDEEEEEGRPEAPGNEAEDDGVGEDGGEQEEEEDDNDDDGFDDDDAPLPSLRSVPEASTDMSDDDFSDEMPLLQIVQRKKAAVAKAQKKLTGVKRETSGVSSRKEETPTKRGRVDSDEVDTKVFDVSLYEVAEVAEPLTCSGGGAGKWWNLEALPHGQKWQTLRHNGVLFPPAYQPHRVAMLYDGEPVHLTPAQEEVATFYAAMLDTDYINNPKFNANFFNDWKAYLGKDHVIQKLEKCDFTPIKVHLDQVRETKKANAKLPDVKFANKNEKERLEQIYGYAMVDECREKVGNFRVEPPGLFRGRGDHPKTGRLKTRLKPEDITINIGRGEKIPKCSVEGNWRGVVHNNKVTWLAFWKENINDAFKYIYLHSSSRFKGQSDIDKFEKARQLHHYIGRIRQSYMHNMQVGSGDLLTRQRATALWIIDVLALRVGNEKGEDEADTVGCCSLRVEHLSFVPPNRVGFDFLGKDSMRYLNEVEVEQIVFKNLKSFCKGKAPSDQVFDQLSTTSLNTHLKELMPGLSAKVFRTYNASVTLEKELQSPTIDKSEDEPIKVAKETDTVHQKVYYYNRANREVAILCNHQKSVPKSFDAQMEKLDGRRDAVVKDRDSAKSKLKALNKLKRSDMSKSEETKHTAAKQRLKDRITRFDERLLKMEMDKKLKSDNKSVALGTSKINYMDPRITVAWCKRLSVPIEKVFNKSLLEKFPWAMEAPMNWRHRPEGTTA